MSEEEFVQESTEGKYGRLPEYYENLFRPTRYDDHTGLFTRVFYPGFAGVIALTAVCVYNLGTRRPLFSGIQKHILATGAGVYAGEELRKAYQRSAQERDTILRHYILLHPEDFPEPERVKYKDVFLPWPPSR